MSEEADLDISQTVRRLYMFLLCLYGSRTGMEPYRNGQLAEPLRKLTHLEYFTALETPATDVVKCVNVVHADAARNHDASLSGKAVETARPLPRRSLQRRGCLDMVTPQHLIIAANVIFEIR